MSEIKSFLKRAARTVRIEDLLDVLESKVGPALNNHLQNLTSLMEEVNPEGQLRRAKKLQTKQPRSLSQYIKTAKFKPTPFLSASVEPFPFFNPSNLYGDKAVNAFDRTRVIKDLSATQPKAGRVYQNLYENSLARGEHYNALAKHKVMTQAIGPELVPDYFLSTRYEGFYQTFATPPVVSTQYSLGQKPGTVRLFRGEPQRYKGKLPGRRIDQLTSYGSTKGRWFTSNVGHAIGFSEGMFTTGDLYHIDVPLEVAEKFKVINNIAKNPILGNFSYPWEWENEFILPPGLASRKKIATGEVNEKWMRTIGTQTAIIQTPRTKASLMELAETEGKAYPSMGADEIATAVKSDRIQKIRRSASNARQKTASINRTRHSSARNGLAIRSKQFGKR